MEASYGRHRKSIANIEDELHNLISEHPRSHLNDNGEPVIPGDALVDIMAGFSESHNDVELMSKDEENQLMQFLASNDGIEATPKVLVEFIALRTTTNDAAAAAEEAFVATSISDEGSDNDSPDDRGRGYYNQHSRSSSTDSIGTSVYRPTSRPSSRGPPATPSGKDSVFDTSKRQRSTPLAAPSSWAKRPPPAHRRKSDAGRASSDSESSISAGGRRKSGGSRSRNPSNPSSPTITSSDSFSPMNKPSSRPQSRNQHNFNLNALGSYYGSPDRGGDSPPNSAGLSISPPSSADNSLDEQSFLTSINSLQMPRSADSDSDSDGEEPSMLIYDRSTASSTASLEPTERLEALQRINTDLSKKLMEAERTLQNRLTEHEFELEEMQGRLEEAKTELTATKKEEKELRIKERQNSTQISALESEIAKLQRNLDNARVSYQSLQKQYQEQCNESERYRVTLRSRDDEIKDHHDAAAMHALEAQKWGREQTAYDELVAKLEHDLAVSQEVYVELEHQKQENMYLKETIDRMRFDLDEMRSSATASTQPTGSASARGSMTKSLAAEWHRNGVSDKPVPTEDPDTTMDTEVPEMDGDTDEEDYIQTIITKTRKRKVPGRPSLSTVHMEESSTDYSDAQIQYDYEAFARSSAIQTDPEPIIPKTSFSVQTEDTPFATISTQTDPEPVPIPKVTTEMEIQTDEPEPVVEPELENTPEEDNSASSSTTLLPPTPKKAPAELHDLPPAYNQVTNHDQDELALKIANETLKQWHKGIKLPIEPLGSGVSSDALEEWKALKEELGVECSVIDKMLEESMKTNRPRPSSSISSKDSSRSRGGRFYNIYNTYVYGSGSGSPDISISSLATHVLICVGASAAVVFLMTHSSPPYTVPGGPTHYDRAAWSSFNTMSPNAEGFAGDGTSAVWNFLGRFAGGAARVVRGWPT